MKKYKYYIGIDPGVLTGITVYCSADKRIVHSMTTKIHDAMRIVENWDKSFKEETFVRVEDARQRKWFGGKGRGQLQGAGSIKRDCRIWDEFLNGIGVDFEMVAPKDNKTKLTAAVFNRLTKYRGRTSEHARDSAMLVFGL